MGCHTYRVGSGRDKAYLRFSEGDDATTCLCTFPHNYAHEQAIDANTVRSMALLGAAVAMAWHGDLHPNDTGDVVLPASLPAWVVQAIDAALPGGREGDKSPLVKGALDAQDERERNAAARVGMVHNCDWPDQVADALLDARAEKDVLAARVAAAEAEKRAVFCIYCHDVRKYVPADDAARADALAWMARHEQECPNSPIVQRLKEAEARADRAEALLRAYEADPSAPEPPIVKGALDAQADAERRLFAAQARIGELETQLAGAACQVGRR